MALAKHKFLLPIWAIIVLSLVVHNASAQQLSRVPDKRVKSIINDLADATKKYRNTLDKELKNTRYSLERYDARGPQAVDDLERAAENLKNSFRQGNAASADVDELLRRATSVNYYVNRNAISTGADNYWGRIRQNVEDLSDAYRLRWRGNTIRTRAYRLSDDEVREILDRIKSGTEGFRRDAETLFEMDRAIDRSARDSINKELKAFRNLADKAKGKVGDDDAGTPDIEDLLRRGAEIDQFLSVRRRNMTNQVWGDWVDIRKNLYDLARAYRGSLRQFDSLVRSNRYR